MDETEVPEAVLNQWSLSGGRVTRLQGGRMNRHWLVETSGERLVLQRYHDSRALESVRWEQALIAHVGRRGWPVAVAKAGVTGTTTFPFEGAVWSVGSFLEGEPGDADSVAMRTIYGRLLARLHNDMGSFEGGGQRPGLGKTWELDVLVEPAGGGGFNALLAQFAREYPELAARIRRERYRNLRELSRLHYPDLPDRPIHGDFQPWNLLFREGQLTGLLDFDQCRIDALACDIAPLLMPFQPLEPRLAAAFFSGYESLRAMSGGEWEILPALVRAALLWWVAHLLVRWRLDGEAPAGIARTMTQRFPAFDAYEPTLRGLRTR